MKIGFRCILCNHIYPLSSKEFPKRCVECKSDLKVKRVKRKWFKWIDYTEEDEYKELGINKEQLMIIDKLFLEKCIEVNHLRRKVNEIKEGRAFMNNINELYARLNEFLHNTPKADECTSEENEMYTDIANLIVSMRKCLPSEHERHRTYDIVLKEKPCCEGLVREEVMKLHDHLNDVEGFLFEVESSYDTIASGFITADAAEKLDYLYEESGLCDFIRNILDDVGKESSSGKYEFNGLDILIIK